MARSQKNKKQSNKTRKYVGGNYLSADAIDHVIMVTFEGMNATKEEEEKTTKLLRKILPELTFERGYSDCNGRTADGLREQAILKARCWVEDAYDRSSGGEFKIQSRYFGKTGPERHGNNHATKAHDKKYGRMLRSNPKRPKSPEMPPSPGEEESVKSKSPTRSASRSPSSSKAKTQKRGFLSSIFSFARK
jgi:hypothetical protein